MACLLAWVLQERGENMAFPETEDDPHHAAPGGGGARGITVQPVWPTPPILANRAHAMPGARAQKQRERERERLRAPHSGRRGFREVEASQ
jgi:hypothetical protein